MTGDRKPILYVDDEFDIRDGRFSPDGRWVAYTAIEPSGPQVFVRSFPAGSIKLQISNESGSRAVWRNDGKELFYVGRGGQLMAVDVTAGERFEAGAPTPLFQTGLDNALLTFDVYGGGQRFVMPAAESDQLVTVILNWPGLLNKR